MKKATFSRVAVICGVFSVLVSCTQAGPFVTSISSNGPNKLLIEKCYAHHNGFMGTVSNDSCTTHELTFQTQPNANGK